MPTNVLSFDPNDDPAGVVNVTSSGTSFVNFGNVLWGIVDGVGIWPPPSNQRRQINLQLVDYTMNDCVGLHPGDTYDGTTVIDIATNTAVERARFEGNG